MRSILSTLALATTALAFGACNSTTCGEGTVLEGGQCIPDQLGKCGPGSTLVGDTCKVQCQPGTIAGTNGCIVAEGACGPGTELVDGKCAPVDLMKTVTDPQAAEPNDTLATARRVTLPAAGSDAIVLGGIIEAQANGDPDYDAFAFTVGGPTRIKVDAVAVGVPSVGVVLAPAAGNGLTRYVASLEGRDASRELVLPAAGEYLLKVTEATHLLPGARSRGGESFSYVVRVSQTGVATPRALASDGSAAGLWVDGDLLDVPGDGTTRLYQVTLATEGSLPFAGLRGLWGVDAEGRTVLATQDRLDSTGAVVPMAPARLVVPGSGARLLVDPVIAFGAGRTQRYALQLKELPVRDAGATSPATLSGTLDPDHAHFYSFEAQEGTIVTADTDSIDWDIDLRLAIYDATFQLIGETTSSYGLARGLIARGRGGRCYVIVEDTSPDATDTDLDYRITLSGEPATLLPELAVPTTTSAEAAVGSSTTGAWFVLSAQKDAILRVAITPDQNVRLTARPHNDKFITIGDSVSSNASGVVNFERIFVRAGAAVLFNVTATGAAQLLFEVEAKEPKFIAEVEPNDSATSAQGLVIQPDGTAEVQAILGETDTDLFRIDLPNGAATLTLATDYGLAGGSPDTVLRLLDEGGRELDEDDDGGPSLFSLIEQQNVPSGTYYIEVTNSYGYGYADEDYALMVKVVE